VTLQLPETRQQAPAELSTEVSDWQTNLKRTWQGLVDDFIKIRERDVTVIDPLLDAQEQQLLKAQLRGYLSQAQTALMDKQASVFFTALKQAQQHLEAYFAADKAEVKAMQSALIELQQQPLQFSRPMQLSSEQVLKSWLAEEVAP
jgi:uroporphyrin-3 C-methyltransferase/uroporphyrinogen III methyltransferase/synthase